MRMLLACLPVGALLCISACVPKADLARFPVIDRLDNVVSAQFNSPGMMDTFSAEPAKAVVEIVEAGPEQLVGRAKPTVGASALKPEVGAVPSKSSVTPHVSKSEVEQSAAKARCTGSGYGVVVTAARLVPVLSLEKRAQPDRMRRERTKLRYSIKIVNTGIVDVCDVTLKDCLPPEVSIRAVTGAVMSPMDDNKSSTTCWKLDVVGTLRPHEAKVVTLETEYVPKVSGASP